MDKDPCASPVGWSVFQSAQNDLTLAGVLAGFLIAVVAALVVQWYDRSSPRMIALFASGVPALTLSSFLFTISAGANPAFVLAGEKKPDEFLTNWERNGAVPQQLPENARHSCNQAWSQWLPAFAMLLIGGSVLLCGLGWALVIYSDHLAVQLKGKDYSKEVVQENQRFFIGLSAWLSLAGTTGGAGLLIVANVVYLKATAAFTNSDLTLFEMPNGVRWRAMFLVLLFGIYVMARSAYLVTSHAISFRTERHRPRFRSLGRAMGNGWVRRAFEELIIAAAVALGLLAACALTAKVGRFSSGRAHWTVVVVMVVYAVARLLYCVVFDRYQRTAPKNRVASSVDQPEGTRTEYSGGRLMATSYNVVSFAILATIFSAVLTQGPLISSWRIGLTLFIGGAYPACILLGLSYAVAGSPDVKLPKWKTLQGLRLLP